MALLAQSWTALLLGVAAVGAGVAITGWLGRWIRMPAATHVAMIGGTGLVFIGVATLIAGYLNGLAPWLPYALAVAGVLLGLVGRHELVSTVKRAAHGIAGQVRRYPVPLIAVSLALLVAVVATFVPPARQDEIDYHWPAPMAWAANGGWNESPLKYVNGFPFMEIIYTAAATQGSYVAAHLLHFGSFLVLGFAAAGVASSMGVRGTGVTAAAVLAMPVVWDWSYVAYNDTPVAAFIILALSVVLAASPRSIAAALVAGGLLAAATSVKPTGAAGAGLIGLVILMRYLYSRRSGARVRSSFPRVLAQWGLLIGPVLLIAVFWSVRQYLFTGILIESRLVEPPTGEAVSRLPGIAQKLFAPFLPFVSGIIGSFEPWGGRTALVIQLFLIPVIVYVLWRRGDVLRRVGLMLVPAWASWIVLGLAIVRTRFHVASWAMFVIALRIAVEDAGSRYPKLRFWLELAWTVCILLSLIDVSFEMVRHLMKFGAPAG